MNKSRLLGAACTCLVMLGMPGIADAALIGRLPTTPDSTDYQAYYDNLLDVTWLQKGYIGPTPQLLTWQEAMDWTDSLSILGFTEWRLPTMDKNGDGDIEYCTSGQVCLDNELQHMYYFNGVTRVTPDPFQLSAFINPSNTQLTKWSSTVPSSDIFALGFSFWGGRTAGYGRSSEYSAWAVHDGDIGAVPLPASAWFFGSGILGLIGMARRKNACTVTNV